MIGTRTTWLKPRDRRFWICVQSLVERVIREAVENRSISSMEKAWTRRKT